MKFETIFAFAVMTLGTTTTEAMRLSAKDLPSGNPIPVCNGYNT